MINIVLKIFTVHNFLAISWYFFHLWSLMHCGPNTADKAWLHIVIIRCTQMMYGGYMENTAKNSSISKFYLLEFQGATRPLF